MDLSPRSMASVWLVGLEDVPEHCGEICVFEIFGEAIADGSAEVGMGIKDFRDPALTLGVRRAAPAVDPSEFHVYAADWQPGRVEFSVDGTVGRSSTTPPTTRCRP